MKLSVNRNTLWCDIFVSRLAELGVKYAAISPGSRSTPLTIAFSTHKNFKIFPIVDERSSSFFALGLAKESGTPVVIVTTSGTAVAELYPAIIEAYYQRVPLIICTADRPPYLRGKGANQTINQFNIFANHIRAFYDVELPKMNLSAINKFKKRTDELILIGIHTDPGPVHFNFPFDKPFEPDNYTDRIEVSFLEKVVDKEFRELKAGVRKINSRMLLEVIGNVDATERGIIFCGYGNFSEEFKNALVNFSELTGYPLIADVSSGLRFGPFRKTYMIENGSALFKSEIFLNRLKPKLILHFGGSPTSNVVIEFMKNTTAKKIIINQFGDWTDPTLTAKTLLEIDPLEFIEHAMTRLNSRVKRNWAAKVANANALIENHKKEFFEKQNFSFEGKIVFELANCMPEGSNLMISNSLPIRDFDFFTSTSQKKIRIFCNRGASGIDGITSTALGISASSKKPTLLITGDLAFYHDLNGLHNAYKFGIPLVIVLVNNGGGGIFESLPISKFGKLFTENFLTPLNLNFKNAAILYGADYFKVEKESDFSAQVKNALKRKKLTIIEIKTDSKESRRIRDNFWRTSLQKLNSYFNDSKNRTV